MKVLTSGLRRRLTGHVVQEGGGGPRNISKFGVLPHGGRDRNVIFQAETDIVQRPVSAGSKLRFVKTVTLPGQHLVLQIIVMPSLLEQVQSKGRFEHCPVPVVETGVETGDESDVGTGVESEYLVC